MNECLSLDPDPPGSFLWMDARRGSTGNEAPLKDADVRRVSKNSDRDLQ